MPISVFAGGPTGDWQVERIEPVTGPSLPVVSRLAVLEDPRAGDGEAVWALRGATSYKRYTQRHEQEALDAKAPRLGLPQATRAALIPITKSDAWWELAQDERREIIEETSHHIGIGLDYLPAVARQLYHARDLAEQFDFLTWFEYAPQDAGAFEELVDRLRATAEWGYVEREVDIRLAR